MKKGIIKVGFLIIGLMGVAATAEQALLARESPARSGSDSENSWEKVRSLKARFQVERIQGEEAAAAGSYKDAVQHFKSVKSILGMERAVLEKLIVTASDGDEMARVRREIDHNSARHSEVKEMLSILRLAVGSPY